jgi:hypothetical protein
MMADIKGRILASEDDGAVLHIEMETANGETVEGVYELIGWTKPPKDVKTKTEQELWVTQMQLKPTAQ